MINSRELLAYLSELNKALNEEGYKTNLTEDSLTLETKIGDSSIVIDVSTPNNAKYSFNISVNQPSEKSLDELGSISNYLNFRTEFDQTKKVEFFKELEEAVNAEYKRHFYQQAN